MRTWSGFALLVGLGVLVMISTTPVEGAAQFASISVQAGDVRFDHRARLMKVTATTYNVLAGGSLHTCGLTGTGSVKCWGYNSEGAVGNGTDVNQQTPANVIGLISDVTAIAAGGDHSCGLTGGGGVKCWGNNSSGQLGDGTTDNRSIPVDVTGLTSGVIGIVTGADHTCALTSGGGVKCWGSSQYGQLGNGTSNTISTTPVDVTGLGSGVIKISSGGNHVCALTTSDVKCWGFNLFGQLGDGTNTSRSTPVSVTGLSGATAMAAGFSHTCALISAGGMKCWGGNAAGQLGTGNMVDVYTPIDVTGLATGVTSIAAGGVHTCALIGGGMKCWGGNSYGELGDGTTTNRLTPIDVNGLTSGVTKVTVGGYHTCAVKDGDSAKCWGWNYFGQLGNGTTQDSSIPVDIAEAGPAVAVIPTSGGTLLADDQTLLSFPSGTFTSTVIVTYTPSLLSNVPAIGKLQSIGHVFDIRVVFSGTTQLAQPAPGKTYTVTVPYTGAERGPTIESSLKLYYWNGSQWLVEPTSLVYPAENLVVATPNHFSIWAVLGETRRVYLPVAIRTP